MQIVSRLSLALLTVSVGLLTGCSTGPLAALRGEYHVTALRPNNPSAVKVKVSRHIMDFDGTPLTDGTDGKPQELRYLLCRALDYTAPQKSLSASESVERYRAMQRIMLEDEPDIALELMAIAKENLAKCYIPRVAGQAILMLEGADG